MSVISRSLQNMRKSFGKILDWSHGYFSPLFLVLPFCSPYGLSTAFCRTSSGWGITPQTFHICGLIYFSGQPMRQIFFLSFPSSFSPSSWAQWDAEHWGKWANPSERSREAAILPFDFWLHLSLWCGTTAYSSFLGDWKFWLVSTFFSFKNRTVSIFVYILNKAILTKTFYGRTFDFKCGPWFYPECPQPLSKRLPSSYCLRPCRQQSSALRTYRCLAGSQSTALSSCSCSLLLLGWSREGKQVTKGHRSCNQERWES